jgi:serine/threonine protein phosphatase PrpC
VYRRSKEDAELDGMGTTLVGALFEAKAATAETRGKMWIAHVGDSRCYLLRGKLMHLLTLDHSVVEEQVRAGFMSASDAATSPMRHVITRAIGAHATVEPEIQSIDVYAGDLLLLASDGLNRELQDEDIHQILHQVPGSPNAAVLERACRSLVDAANATGGYDNVTVMLVYVD